MAADATAYAVLGLEPGAEWTSVERAYKALIKANHPDRAGGDALRAAEITRAYRELRQARATPDDPDEPWPEPEPFTDVRRRSSGWLAVLMGVAGGAALLVTLATPVSGLIDDFRMRAGPLHIGHRPSATPVADPMTQPLAAGNIKTAIIEAVRLAQTNDDAGLAEASRACNAQLQAVPSFPQLDRCAAFDDAVIELENRDPLRDDSAFGEVAVTGRLMSGASLLSNDYLAIDSRLAKIRLQVELALAPSGPPPEANVAG